jgi:hypothetical protein
MVKYVFAGLHSTNANPSRPGPPAAGAARRARISAQYMIDLHRAANSIA